MRANNRSHCFFVAFGGGGGTKMNGFALPGLFHNF